MYKSKGQLNKPELDQVTESLVTEAQLKPRVIAQQALKDKQSATEKHTRKTRRQTNILLVFAAIAILIGGMAYNAAHNRWEAGSIAVEDLTSLTITLNINSQPQVISTNSTTVSELLSELRIRLGSDDYIGLEMEQKLYDGMTVWLRLAVPITINADGASYQLNSQPITVQQALSDAGVALDADDVVSLPLLKYVYNATDIRVYRMETKRENVDEEIEPPLTAQEYTYLTPGSSIEVYAGKPGIKRSVYDVTYRDGVEVERVLIESSVAQEPEAKIMGYGPSTAEVSAMVDEDGNPLLYTATTDGGASFYYTQSFTVESTAYTWTGNKTATGTWPAQGRTIAVDPKVIPLGTKVYVVGYGFATAEDTGGAIKGNIIDLYMDNEQDCWSWGRRNVTIYILPE